MSEQYQINGIKHVAEKKLIGFRVLCAGDQYAHEIPKAAKALADRKHEISRLVEPAIQLGVFQAHNLTDDDDGYWVCYEVEEYANCPSGMVTLTVPEQSYAVMTYEGQASGIYHIYRHLHQWMAENNHSRNPSAWTLENYRQWQGDSGTVDLYDPIKVL